MSTVRIYEVVLGDSGMVTNAGAEVLRIDNKRPEWRELQAYAVLYREGLYKSADYVGVISSKFSKKTKVGIDDFTDFVNRNHEAEVCFINPFPQLAYWSLNVWMQGEHAHPGLLDSARKLFGAFQSALEIDPTLRHGPADLCYCNFWVARSTFWERYVGGVLMPLVEFLEASPDAPAAIQVLTETYHTDPAPYLPFIVERCFSTYLASHRALPRAAWRHTLDKVLSSYCLNEFERVLVSGLAKNVELLDQAGGGFDSAMYKQMDLYCALFQQHSDDYYSYAPHPHTGYPLPKKINSAINNSSQ